MVSVGWGTRSSLAHGTSSSYCQMLVGLSHLRLLPRGLAHVAGGSVAGGLSSLLHGPLPGFAVERLEHMKVGFPYSERAKRARRKL